MSKAYMLADAQQVGLAVQQDGDHVSVTLPSEAPDQIDSVLVLEQK